MGACTFINVATGDTAERAFNDAVSQAGYEYGHSYSGSIAEKDSFVTITRQPMSRDDAVELADRLLRDDDERISDKWGPAGAIPVTDGSWVFFGWASS